MERRGLPAGPVVREERAPPALAEEAVVAVAVAARWVAKAALEEPRDTLATRETIKRWEKPGLLAVLAGRLGFRW